jgi:hypothetical protein
VALVTQALRGLAEHALAPGEDADVDEATQIATLALRAVAVTIKFLVTRHGAAVLPGLGRFVASGGEVRFQAEDAFARHVFLTERDDRDEAQAQAVTILGVLERVQCPELSFNPWPAQGRLR